MKRFYFVIYVINILLDYTFDYNSLRCFRKGNDISIYSLLIGLHNMTGITYYVKLILLICVAFLVLFFLAEVCKQVHWLGMEDNEQPHRHSRVVFSALAKVVCFPSSLHCYKTYLKKLPGADSQFVTAKINWLSCFSSNQHYIFAV